MSSMHHVHQPVLGCPRIAGTKHQQQRGWEAIYSTIGKISVFSVQLTGLCGSPDSSQVKLQNLKAHEHAWQPLSKEHERISVGQKTTLQ